MNESARATTVVLVGAMLVRLAVDGTYTRYVRAEMGWALAVTGALLVALGLIGLIRLLLASFTRAGDHAHQLDHSHDGEHAHGTGVAWLLLATVVVLLVTPPALGSYGLDRNATNSVTATGETFAPLPAGKTATLTLREFTLRAADNAGVSLGSSSVQLTGFVAKSNDGTGFRIARYKISCCAADGSAAIVRVVGATGSAPAVDQWVTVTGTFRPTTGTQAGDPPELLVSTMSEISSPSNPYE
ncbi:TIGR03943 family protein (plasmid) [Rhodococcus qingshengii]|uniref:TIGR03943 family putative permease subunit n=1 Tax=Rhodococcus qingshengii TaxID=334542 RepID=UPI000A7BC140|nr:TIGR03943 family protein [Rhodococcus qingshengii]BCF86296.1 TIGR03943 family protein [Rhodococcus qingshengii]